jgi:hypothetical protein
VAADADRRREAPRLDVSADRAPAGGPWRAVLKADAPTLGGDVKIHVHVVYAEPRASFEPWTFVGWSADDGGATQYALQLPTGDAPSRLRVAWPGTLAPRGVQVEIRDATGSALRTEGYAYPMTTGEMALEMPIPPEAQGGSVTVRDLGASAPYAWDLTLWSGHGPDDVPRLH